MEYAETLINNILDFDSDRRKNWERDRKPYSAIFELTPKCNMNCIHCYLQKSHSETQLSTGEVLEILDILHDKGILFITLTGGEILTRKDFLEIYLYAKKKGFFVELFTNAFLFNDEIIDVLKQYPPILVDVSLYGSCDETYKKITGIDGAFTKVIDNCRKIKESGIRIAFKSPIMKETYGEIDAMKKVASDMGILFRPSFEIIPIIDGDEASKERQLSVKDILSYEISEHEKNKTDGIDRERKEAISYPYIYDCKIGISSFVIDYNGNMCPCMRLRHHGRKLTCDNFDEIWESYAEYKKMKFPEDNKCRSCTAREYCDVCPAEREFVCGDIFYRCADDCKYALAREDYYRNNVPSDEILQRFV